jgi:hypothetical protein
MQKLVCQKGKKNCQGFIHKEIPFNKKLQLNDSVKNSVRALALGIFLCHKYAVKKSMANKHKNVKKQIVWRQEDYWTSEVKCFCQNI